MGHGYAGIDNELYVNPKAGIFFSEPRPDSVRSSPPSRHW